MKTVWIDYTNYRGVRGWREIEPYSDSLNFAATQFHPEEQWLLCAWDVEKQAERTFAMKDIHEWQTENPHGNR